MSAQRRRGSFTARLRTEIGESEPPAAEPTTEQEGFPCPSQIRPLLHFYKYLQPLPSGRKLQLNLPATVVCEKRCGKEEVLSLRTDALGNVLSDDKGPTWRKRLLTDFIGEDHQNAASLLSVALDDVVAVRNVAHWRSTGSSSSGGINSKSLVLTRRAFDYVINAPSELAFSVQQYVRCRGSHASIFRVTWGERENRRFAINICNGKKITDAPPLVSNTNGSSSAEPRVLGTPLDLSLQQMVQLSPYYLVTATSGSDVKKHQEQLKLPRIRGNPVAEGVNAVKRVIDHVTAQLPGIKLRELTADFIKDDHGVWWFIRVVHVEACYRVAVPSSVSSDYDMDSAVVIPEVLRSKYFRQLLRTFPSVPPENAMIPQCSLCDCSCDLPKPLREELKVLAGQTQDSDGSSGEVFNILYEYRMTLKMVITTLFQLRQRGVSLSMWEHVALLLIRTPAGLASEFTVCYLCYRIYKSQLQLARMAAELHEVYGVQRPHEMADEVIEDPREEQSTEALVDQIRLFYNEKCVSFVAEEPSPVRNQLACYAYSQVKGVDIDPTCLQLRLAFFFHELQDGGPDLSPADFYLEYHIGQQFTRLDFDGSKRHTPNRWQLCEARAHYLLTTLDGFSDYCNEKRLRIKMKTVLGDEYHGHTSMSLRPLLSAAKWYGKMVENESRVDYLLELKTDAFGLLTLKLTLGLLVDKVPLSQVRELMKHKSFLREDPCAIFWPPASFQSCSLVVPVDWVGALAPSEYVTLQPVRSRRNPADRRRMGAVMHKQKSIGSAASRQQILLEAKSPSQVFSASQFHQATTALGPAVETEGVIDTGAAYVASRTLAAVIAVAKRVIYRVAGEVATFPVAFLGQILFHASFLLCDNDSSSDASWTAPASFLMTKKHTIDTLFHGIELPPTAALCVASEICLVLSRSRILPPEASVALLEQLLEPYWLAGVGAHDDAALSYEPLSSRSSSVQSQHRIVWNRAIRRCQVAHFCGGFRVHDRFANKQKHNLQTRHSGISMYEGMQALSRKMSYRAKIIAHKLCEIFEAIEVFDSGYTEIAEFRSFHKQCMVKEQLRPKPSPMGLYYTHDHLPAEELASLDSLLTGAHEIAERTLVKVLMESEPMLDTLAQFDRMGYGGMNFDEFWDLAENVLRVFTSSCTVPEDEPTCSVFCLRHGTTEGYALDRCCVRCSAQYQDQELLPPNQSSRANPESESNAASDEEEDHDEEEEIHEKDEKPVEVQLRLKAQTTQRLSQRLTERRPTVKGDESEQLEGDSYLVDTLEKLEAAEWHVRHRRESLGHAALEAALSGRCISGVATARRTSSVSSSSNRSLRPKVATDTAFAVTDFVAEAEERKQLAFGFSVEGSRRQLERLPSKTKPTKQQPTVTKKKKRRTRSAAQHSTRLQSSQSLSTLLRMELEDAKHSGRCDVATRSTKLIETVHRGESKRKQLDRLVLAELDDVKQRLARLLESS